MKQSYLALTILVASASAISAYAAIEQQHSETQQASQTDSTAKPPTSSGTVARRGSRVETRSPQGLDDNVETRRNTVLGRPGRNTFNPIVQNGREVRSYDGTGNNRRHPTWGASFSQLQRLAPAAYTDGVSSMAGSHLKSAREISNLIVSQADGESIENSYNTSDFLWQWGQFIDHDIGLTDGSTAEQEPITVPTGDVFFDPLSTGEVVIPFSRAIYDPDSGTDRRNVREQENEISSWIDGSMIYGSSRERNQALRAGPNSPFLATSEGNLLPFNNEDLANANGFFSDPSALFLAGDVRANEQAGLTAMHVLWVREHNRIAALIQQQRPEMPNDAVYELARRLVIAEIQIITYNEYLPALLGENTMPPYRGYDERVNPTIYNEFSAAAYRFGHSEVSDTLLRLDENGDTDTQGNLSLREAFFGAAQLFNDEHGIDSLLRGMAAQKHQAIDAQVVNNLRNFLFGAPGAGGFDLVSLNIQRGRDHGLSSYNETRLAMNLRPARRFADINPDSVIQTNLFNAYGSVDDVELWVGGLAEQPMASRGSQLGELFTAINVKQFDRLRAGDRFWYQHYLTPEEKAMVQDVTLAKVIQMNTDIGEELQDKVFYVE